MSKILLNNVSKIDSGKSFRQRIEDDPNGNCLVIQMKDISHEQLTITGSPQSILLDEINPNQLLNKGDILFMAKGNNNFAVMYASGKPAVAVSLFFIIRPKRDKIDPEYLTWYLNSPTAQAYFHERRLGASVGNIRKETLESLEVEFPPLERQLQIAKLNSLLKDEKKITNEYLEKKEIFINQSMLNLITK
ncbi:MAG: restriction endonuclease subunit S [Crocinitomicaceae bacterium]